MEEILGLDLGTNSIGWAIVEAEFNQENKVESYQNIIDAGVRIFPEGVENIGQGDKEQSKNSSRRDHRQSRRQYFRKRYRKIKLLELLIDLNMCPLPKEELRKWKNWDKALKSEGRRFPDNPAFMKWLKMNPYLLRTKALQDDISLHEFGRILYHLIQRRGFISSRKGKEDGNIFKGKENMTGINQTLEEIEGYETLGEFLHAILPPDNEPFKNRDKRVRARYTTREMYVREFYAIWNRQKANLGLEKLTIPYRKERYYQGTKEKNKVKEKIDYLKNTKKPENLEVKENVVGDRTITRVLTQETKPLLEALAGNIWQENGDLKFQSNESILFYQRPLRTQKALLGKCRYESHYANVEGKKKLVGKSPCPVSHPEFEMFRAYQYLNNIKYGKGIPLEQHQKDQVLELLNSKEGNIKFEEIPKLLHMTHERFNYSDDMSIPGNPTISQLRKLFPEDIWNDKKEEIWHCFYFYDDNEKLFEKVKNAYQLDLKKYPNPEKLDKIKLKDGYGSISLKAIRNILPFLEIGCTYDQAVILGGIKNVFGSNWNHFSDKHEVIINDVKQKINQRNMQGETIGQIKEYLSAEALGFGFKKNDKRFSKLYHHSQDIQEKVINDQISPIENLRNPIVQQGLNELRRLVNSLQLQYGPFRQIKIEIGRDLKIGKQKRQEQYRQINENQQANEIARNRLAEFGLSPTRENIHKFLLYQEIEDRYGTVVCPYTGKTMNISDVLGSENMVQIEHIIPYSISLNDSFGNKTLCEANFNREKGELSPYEFYHKKNSDPTLWGASTWQEVEERAFKLLPYNKAMRFVSRTRPDKEEFIERQLNDTRYISKKAKEILSEICKDVRAVPGALTSELRHLWGLNNILQPVKSLPVGNLEVDEYKPMPHYLVLNEQNQVKEIIPVYNRKPDTADDEIVITGNIKKENFTSMFYKIETPAPGKPDGKYWAVIKVKESFTLYKYFTDKPLADENTLVLKGKIEKGVLRHDSLGKINSNYENGTYWAVIPVTGAKIEPPKKNKKPGKKSKQVLLFGKISNGVFESYVYQCQTDLPDGKYWITLDVDIENIEFLNVLNEKPNEGTNELLIKGNLNHENIFSADNDKDFSVQADAQPGKYWLKLEILSEPGNFLRVENEMPKLSKGEQLIEGNTWVDRQTGEIKFDPKKNRDDNRHHAIDAITIAVTEQSFLQKFSTYNARIKKHERGLDEKPTFDQPWTGFDEAVKQVTGKILVSYKQNNKILSHITKTIEKNGRTFQSEGYAARGRLHREYFFGGHPRPVMDENGKFKFNGKNIQVEKDKHGNEVNYFHIRKPITSIQTHKHVNKIVDEGIRDLIQNRLEKEYGIDLTKGYKIPEGFFYKKDEDGRSHLNFFLPNRNGEKVPVKKIRMREYIGNATKLKDDTNLWVNPYNNHHVLICKDNEDNLKEEVVSFWTVVERLNQGQDAYQLPLGGKEIVTILQENDMFLLGLDENTIQELNNQNYKYEEVSPSLYRLQKISSMYYTFRHHLASNIDNPDEEIRITSFSAWKNLNPVKVSISSMGKLCSML